MGTIQERKRKNGTVYRAMIRIKGLPEQQKTFRRRTDAKLWVQQTETAIRKGEFQNVVKTANSKTLADVIERYKDDILPTKAQSTQRAETTYLNFWEQEFGRYALSYIEPDLISKKVRELANAGDTRRQYEKGQAPNKPKSQKTLKHYRDTLELLFKYAKQWGWTVTNPLDGVNRITKFNNERVRFLSDDERERLLAACKDSDNNQLYPVVVFALSTGARKGEILNLTLADMDLGREVAILRETKNRETRAVPIVHHLKDLLEIQIERSRAYYDCHGHETSAMFLFPRRDGLAPIDIRKAWENARDAAKVTDFRFHDLRHSTASYLAMNGASQLEIAEVLGHKTLQMVKRYSHLSEGHVRKVIKDLNEKLF